MQFTYKAYERLIGNLRNHGYQTVSYDNWEKAQRCVILRHDIDYDLDKAVKLAKIEMDLGVKSTYFVLLTSDFYNVFSKNAGDSLRTLKDCGHTIGLHFDEKRYPGIWGCNIEEIRQRIVKEAEVLSAATANEINVVSMHRPSGAVLDADLQIPGMINSYGQTYIRNFKYLSDSRRTWREPVEAIIEAEQFQRLHILTHAFWYNEQEKDIRRSVADYVNNGNRYRYECFQSNITNLEEIMSEEELW